MKKLLTTFTLLPGSLSFLYGSTFNEILKAFGAEANAQMITVNSSTMKAEAGENADKLNDIELDVILNLSECEPSVKDRFEKAVNGMQLDGYEALARVMFAKVYGKLADDKAMICWLLLQARCVLWYRQRERLACQIWIV